MDEVDKIVLSSLRDIGYALKEDVFSLKLYSFEELLQMVIHCLRTIRPETNFPASLPPTMSSRYQICAQFAETCKELGYKRDIGYHTFMYNNVTDIRNVLIFLVEHLPKKNLFDKSPDSLDRRLSVKEKICEELKNIFASKTNPEHDLSACQSPFLSSDLETGTLLPNQKIDCKPIEWRDFVVKDLPFVDEQLSSKHSLLPSLITLNAAGLVNPVKLKSKCLKSVDGSDSDLFSSLVSQSCMSRGYIGGLKTTSNSGSQNSSTLSTASANEFQTGGNITGQAVKMNEDVPISTELIQGKETIAKLESEIEDMQAQITTVKMKLNEVSKNNEIARKKLQEKISHATTLEQSIALLPDHENNIPKLEAANEKCRAKIQKLKDQWNSHKEELMKKRSDLMEIVNQKSNEKDELIQTIFDARKELLDVTEEIQRRNTVEQRLKETEVGNGVQRSEFITRILEMIKNIKKQESQIENTLNDMKQVQKEINTLAGKIERSFAVTEQTIVSNSDDMSRESHKLIITLHKDISDILTMIDETGKYAREIKDLEDQIRDNSNNVEESLKQVNADLERLKGEQRFLQNEIQKFSGVDKND